MDKATDRVLFLILTEHWFDEDAKRTNTAKRGSIGTNG